MLKLKEKINKFNMLIIVTTLLFFTVIGQSVYIARLYAKAQAAPETRNDVKQLNYQNDQSDQSKQSRSIFDEFDDKFMSNHFQEFRKIKEHMDKVFDDAFAEFNLRPGFNDDFSKIFGNRNIHNNLNLELQNEPDKFTVTLKLPNTEKNNVNVKLEGQRLTVNGDVKEQIEESNDFGKQYREYSSKFTRSMVLPEKVKENSLTTKFENGKLLITILKEKTT